MKVKAHRLLDGLRGVGFALGFPTYGADSYTFIRSSINDSLYESIIVEAQGRNYEAVYASVGVSVTKTVMYKGLGDVKVLDEIAEDLERGWTIIVDDSKAREWEANLVRVGPERASEWARLRGNSILKDTEDIRNAIGKYLAIVGPFKDAEQLSQKVRQQSASCIVELANHLHVGGVPGKEDTYQLASLIILRYSEEAEKRSFLGTNPIHDLCLMDRIKLLADRLLDLPSHRRN